MHSCNEIMKSNQVINIILLIPVPSFVAEVCDKDYVARATHCGQLSYYVCYKMSDNSLAFSVY